MIMMIMIMIIMMNNNNVNDDNDDAQVFLGAYGAFRDVRAVPTRSKIWRWRWRCAAAALQAPSVSQSSAVQWRVRQSPRSSSSCCCSSSVLKRNTYSSPQPQIFHSLCAIDPSVGRYFLEFYSRQRMLQDPAAREQVHKLTATRPAPTDSPLSRKGSSTGSQASALNDI